MKSVGILDALKSTGAIVKKAMLFVVYFISGFVPRTSKIWVYGSQAGSFSDNSRYLFLYANREVLGIRHIWISWSTEVVERLTANGYEAYTVFSMTGVMSCLRAGVCLFNHGITDISWPLLKGALRVNLWHGLPLKKMGRDIHRKGSVDIAASISRREKFSSYWLDPSLLGFPPDVFLGVSPLISSRFSSAFTLEDSIICLGGYPRLLPFFWAQREVVSHIELFERNDAGRLVHEFSKYDRVFVYMPTYRDNCPDFISAAIPSLGELNEICRQENVLFVFKLHPYTMTPPDARGFSNLRVASNVMDPYPLLALADVLITDYSSIVFDYAVTRKRVIFYPYDLEVYLRDRGLYESYDDIVYDTIARTFGDLLSAMQDRVSRQDNDRRERLVSRYWGERFDDISGFVRKIEQRSGG
jgi:CDP-glycerol glycerophosphotransferase (TagB/SpsB family)